MWAAQYHRRGGPEVMDIDEVDIPRPQPGQALVRVAASCVSRIDGEFRRGRLPHGRGFPKQTGFDAVGTVVDSNGTALPTGTGVLIVLGLEPFRRRGTTVELLAVEPERCGQFPSGLIPSPGDCALALGGLTALRAVRDAAAVGTGDRVLVVGAGGPVGLASLQIAQLRGARVDVVAGAASVDACRTLGARQVLDHRGDTSDLQSCGDYDAVIVTAGKPRHWLGAARRGGRAALTDGGTWPSSLIAAMKHQVRSIPVPAGHDAGDLTWLAHRIAAGELDPIVGHRYPSTDIRRAHQELGRPGTLGARLIDHEAVNP